MRLLPRAAHAFGLTCGLAGGLLASAAASAFMNLGWDTFSPPSATIQSDSPVKLVDFEEFTVEPACESTACDELCADPFCSTWYASAGAIFLQRSRPTTSAIATPPTGTPGVLINGSDFLFDWGYGPDVTIGKRLQNGLLVEARYFNSQSSDARFLIPAVTTFRTAGIGVTILGGGSLDGFYSTTLNSGEFNVHKQVGDGGLTVLGGFRWIEVDDTLRVNIATPVTFTQWHESNRMFGGQLGLNMAFCSVGNPLQFNGFVKGGVYANNADNQFTSNIVGGTRSQETEAAFVGELGFSASCQITERLALKGGYQVLWLDNVALASDAAANTVQAPGGTSSPPSTDGRVWYNGATVGFDYVW